MYDRLNIKVIIVELNKAKEILQKHKEDEGVIADTLNLGDKQYACFPCDFDNNEDSSLPDYLSSQEVFDELEEASEDTLKLY